MGNLVWVRPSGTEITTNDRKETIEAAAQLGWKPKDQAEKTEAAKTSKKAK